MKKHLLFLFTALLPLVASAEKVEIDGIWYNLVSKAKTAEALMRARYSAYAVKNIPFLKTSAGPEVQAEFDEKASKAWSASAEWHGLEIIKTERGGEGDGQQRPGVLSDLGCACKRRDDRVRHKKDHG